MTKVDTAQLESAVISIRETNRRISTAFDLLQNKKRALDASWDGSASQNAMSAFCEINAIYSQPRYNALESAAKVLEAISSGYEYTEEKNESLANQFK